MQRIFHLPDSTPTPPQHTVPTAATKVTSLLNAQSAQIIIPLKSQQQPQKSGGLKPNLHHQTMPSTQNISKEKQANQIHKTTLNQNNMLTGQHHQLPQHINQIQM